MEREEVVLFSLLFSQDRCDGEIDVKAHRFQIEMTQYNGEGCHLQICNDAKKKKKQVQLIGNVTISCCLHI